MASSAAAAAALSLQVRVLRGSFHGSGASSMLQLFGQGEARGQSGAGRLDSHSVVARLFVRIGELKEVERAQEALQPVRRYSTHVCV